MKLRRWLGSLGLAMALLAVACGDSAAPVITAGTPGTTALPSAAPAATPTPGAGGAAGGQPATLRELGTSAGTPTTARDPAFSALDGAKAYFGQLGKAAYRIEIPDAWNGELVMYAHGFAGFGTEVAVESPPRALRRYLVANGFAWAASSYSENGYVPGIGADDTLALKEHFTAEFGEPKRTYIAGQSMGGNVVALALENHAREYDGGLALCGALGGIEQIDYLASWVAVAEFTSGLTFPIGEPGANLAPIGGFIIHTGWLDSFDRALITRAGWLSGAEMPDLHFTSLFLFAAAVGVVGFFVAAAGGETRPAGGPARRLSFAQLFSRAGAFPACINFASSFVFASMVTFTPLFARDRGLENAGALFIVYAGMVIVMRLSLGRYMDRFPRSWFIVPGIGALAFSMVTMATASNVPQMFIAAGLYGAGAGTFQPAMMAHLVDQTQPAERGRALSTFTLGNDLGLSIGALLLGVLVDWAGYRPAFFVAGAMAASGALLFFASTRRQRGWKAAGATLQP